LNRLLITEAGWTLRVEEDVLRPGSINLLLNFRMGPNCLAISSQITMNELEHWAPFQVQNLVQGIADLLANEITTKLHDAYTEAVVTGQWV